MASMNNYVCEDVPDEIQISWDGLYGVLHLSNMNDKKNTLIHIEARNGDLDIDNRVYSYSVLEGSRGLSLTTTLATEKKLPAERRLAELNELEKHLQNDLNISIEEMDKLVVTDDENNLER